MKISDVAGGKNLLKITREDENGWSYSDKCHYNGTYTMSSNNPEVSTAYIVDGWHYLPYTFTCDGTYDFAFQTSMSIASKCIQLEEGTQATDYEPYIPSVKMLADEVSAQNESLGDYGLDNKAKWNNGNINLDSGLLYPSDNNGIFTDEISCKEGDVISVHEKDSSSIVYIALYNRSKYLNTIESRTATVPTNATNFRVNVRKTGITKNENINIYVNNAIDGLNSDLSALIARVTALEGK